MTSPDEARVSSTGAPTPKAAGRDRWERLRRFRKSLQAEFLATFCLISLLPIGVLIVRNDRATRASLTEAAFTSLTASAHAAAVGIDTFVHTNLAIVETESTLPTFAEYLQLPETERTVPSAKERVRTVLSSLGARDRVFIASYALLDAKGRNLVDTSAILEEDESARYHVSHALEYDEATASGIEFLPASGLPFLYFSNPIRDAAGRPLGVLRVRYSAAILKQVLTEGGGAQATAAFSMVVDDQHMVLAHSMNGEHDEGSLLYALLSPRAPDVVGALRAARRLPPGPTRMRSEAEFSAGLGGITPDRPYFNARLAMHKDMEMAAATVKLRTEPWTVVELLPRDAFLAPVESGSRELLVFALAVTLLVAVTATMAARSLSRPISRLTASASQLASGNLLAEFAVTSRGEIGVLETALQKMAADIRRLVEDLAHQNDTLARQNLRLEEEVVERARNEVVLREQQEAIRRLSTPIIAVWKGVLALPVIGTLDADRAQQMMEKLLGEITRQSAAFAIFDLTGVDRVDAPTADRLLKIVRAAGMLGSRCVLSGISSETAREMVALDLGEGAFVSFRTLEGALRYAIENAGRASTRASSPSDDVRGLRAAGRGAGTKEG